MDVYSSFSVLSKSHVPTPQTQVKKLILHINGVTSPLDNSLLFKCKKDKKEHKRYCKTHTSLLAEVITTQRIFE